ncbi:MAG: LolA family protein [Desulfopila sp.]
MRICSLMVLLVLLAISPALAAEAGRTPAPFQSVSARFVQEKHLNILQTPLVSRGTFTFKLPASLRWEYLEPVHTVLLMADDRVEKFIERDGRLEPEESMFAGAMQYILPEIGNWLDGRFGENRIFHSEERDARTVVLTPKDEGMRSVISQIELHLGEQLGVVESVTISEGPASSTVLRFYDIVVNGRIPEDRFRLK